MNRNAVFFLLIILTAFSSVAVPKKLPVPRYVTIKFNEVNARTGPTKDCPIEWVFIKKGEPVEVIAEYDQWRKIRDINDEGGWVHSSVISGNRSVIFVAKNTMPLVSSPGKYDQIVAKITPQIRCDLHKCEKDWCKVNCRSYKGWIARKFLWGVYPDE
jgi:SH3-like domain-containing protein